MGRIFGKIRFLLRYILIICCFVNCSVFYAQENVICTAIDSFYFIGGDAYTGEMVWKEGRSSVLIKNNDDINRYEWYKLQDNNLSTCWSEGVPGDGINEYILIPFGRPDGLNFNYKKAKRYTNIKCHVDFYNGNGESFELFKKNGRVKKCKIKIYDTPKSVGQNTIVVESEPLLIYDSDIEIKDIREVQEFDFLINLRDDYLYSTPTLILQFIILDVYKGTDYDDTCISEIKVYGEYVD